jgi:predicted dehydrogenase
MNAEQNATKEFRVGVIGAGTMGKVHSEAYRAIEGVRVAAVCDIDPDRAGALAEKHDCRPATEFRDLFEDDGIDIVDICVPTDRHAEILLAALDTDKAIVCEKPLTLHLGEAKDVLAKCGERPNRVFIAHVVRFFPEYDRAHRMVQGGELGRIGVARMHRCGSLPFGGATWFGDDARSGGVLLDLVCHDFDWLNWTFGAPERVYARYRQAPAPNAYKYASAVIRYPGGVLAHVEGSWAHPPGTFFTRFELAGSEGLVDHDSRRSPPLSFAAKQDSGGSIRGIGLPENPFLESPYLVELKHFIRCLRTGDEFLVTVRDAYRACRVSLAALESARTGQPVDLEWENGKS